MHSIKKHSSLCSMFYFSSYGQRCFQLSYNLDLNSISSIFKLLFLNSLARLLVLTNDSYLHLLEINNYNSSLNDFSSNSTV